MMTADEIRKMLEEQLERLATQAKNAVERDNGFELAALTEQMIGISDMLFKTMLKARPIPPYIP